MLAEFNNDANVGVLMPGEGGWDVFVLVAPALSLGVPPPLARMLLVHSCSVSVTAVIVVTGVFGVCGRVLLAEECA